MTTYTQSENLYHHLKNSCSIHWMIQRFTLLLVMLCCALAPLSLALSLDEADRLDDQSVQQLKKFPFSIKANVKTRSANTEFLQSRHQLYLDSSNNFPDRMRLAGLDMGMRLRLAMDNQNYPTKIRSLWSVPACQVDVVMGRHFARYANALARKNSMEMMLVLSEYQNALTCLTGKQVVVWTELLGSQLIEMERQWEVMEWPESSLNQNDRLALFNLVLLTVDISKYSGKNAAHLWLRRYGNQLEPESINKKISLYLYEPFSGRLLGQKPKANQPLHIDELLDPKNIGMGACSFVEMQANGLKTKNFSCARSLGCSQAKPNPINSIFSSNKNLKVSGNSPFGISQAGLQKLNCRDGVNEQKESAGLNGFAQDNMGGSNLDIGSQLGSHLGTGWQACVTATLISQQLGNRYGQCQIKTQTQKQGSPQPSQLPVTGIPAGSSGSCTNPYAQSNESNAKKREEDLVKAKELADKFYETDAGKKLIAEITKKTLEHIRDLKGDPIIGNLDKNAAEKGLKDIDPYIEDATKAAKTATENAKDKDLNPNQQADTVKLGDTGKQDINIDMGQHNSAKGAAGTLVHEGAGHAVINKVAEKTGKSVPLSDLDQHKIMAKVLTENPDLAEKIGKMSGESAKTIIKEIQEQAKEGTQRPNPEGGELCGAAREAMEQFMNCHYGSDFGKPPQSGSPIDPKPGLTKNNPSDIMRTPDPERPSKNNIVSSCMALHGIGSLNIGKDGFLSATLGAGASATGCAAMQCGPDGAARRSGEGACVCSNDSGLVLRDMAADRLCFTSDACVNRLVHADVNSKPDLPIKKLPPKNIP